MTQTLADIAKKINGTLVGDGSIPISTVTSFDKPSAGAITFVTINRDLKALEDTEISAILVPKTITSSKKPIIQTENPKLAFALLLQSFYPPKPFPGQISTEAQIAKSAVLGKEVTVEAFARIGERVKIADGATIRSFAFIGDDTVIGANTIIHPHASVYERCKIGNRVVLHSGVIVGSDGFGYVFDGRQQVKLPQIGTVVIQDDVEIGSCTTIDRAAMGETIIGQGTKIDNQVQIAHNVKIGAHCAISAQCGISGSTKIGNYCTLGGSVGIADHVEIGDGVMLGAFAGVPPGKVIPPKGIWFGQPARPYDEMRKQFGAQLRAAENQDDLRELKKKIAALEKEIETLRTSPK